GEAAEEAEGTQAVSLLTIHAAKGLEFPVVFLVNLRPPRPRDTERLFFDPDNLGFVMKNWRGEKHPRYVDTSPGAPAVALAVGERTRIVYVGITRAKDALYVTATREEPSAHEIGANGLEEHDHFAEIMSWALAHPESALVVESEQLELPVPRIVNGQVHDDPAVVAAVLDRLEQIKPAPSSSAGSGAAPVELSFSQLHDFEVCPVRYRFAQVWRVPAPPDELQPRHVAAIGSTELGAAVHEALAAWHNTGGNVLDLYRGPEPGRGLLQGGRDPRRILFDLRRAEQHVIEPDDALVEDRVNRASTRIASADFQLGPEHAQRPCSLCAYRPICTDARKVL